MLIDIYSVLNLNLLHQIMLNYFENRISCCQKNNKITYFIIILLIGIRVYLILIIKFLRLSKEFNVK